MSARGARPRAGGSGFTLFEVLGVILVTAIVLGVAVNFYIDLSRQATHATENTREVRRAAALLDRVASDLEHTLLVRKPDETDPLAHPWLFLAEARYDHGGADQLKFVRRERPRSSVGPASDLAMVAYTLALSEDEEAGFELRRWSTSELPDGLDRELPVSGDPDALLVTDGIASFALRFLDDLGEWRETWDSSQLLGSSELPVAVEIEVALLGPDGERRDAFAELPRYVRQVLLPLRPLDLELLLDPELAGEGSDEDGGEDEYGDLTLADCIDFAKIGSGAGSVPGLSATDIDTLSALAQQNPDARYAPYAGVLSGHPAVRPECQ